MQPLQRGEWPPIKKEKVQEIARACGQPYAKVKAGLIAEHEATEVWVNDLYQVTTMVFGAGCMHINIRRRDGGVIFRDWRHFQDIKNQLAGPEREAMEIYPAESRLVDTSNKYHLWVLPEGERIPVGWDERDVMNTEGETPGTRQRPR